MSAKDRIDARFTELAEGAIRDRNALYGVLRDLAVLVPLFTLLEESTGDKGGWDLIRNDHRLAYLTIEEQAAEVDYTWEDEDSKHRAFAEDSLFVLQWYPSNPVGFYLLASPDLPGLLRMVNSILSGGVEDRTGPKG